ALAAMRAERDEWRARSEALAGEVGALRKQVIALSESGAAAAHEAAAIEAAAERIRRMFVA
ncbi:MAG TPA: hypothetical protein VM305_08475, partial [Candidatus Limnocylindrales bacterium]|nr:hypothetical protein [Candidatus Limnocylindrales bacterium]